MIAEFFIDCGFGIADGLFAMLPEITWSVDTTAWQYAKDFLDMIAYLLPLNTIIAIITLIVDIAIARVIISVLRVLLSLIPFV